MNRTAESIAGEKKISGRHSSASAPKSEGEKRQWYAIFTVHQHEQTVAKDLGVREIESFLPTYEETRIWKNRQKKTLTLPLFPSYIFARLRRGDYGRVLGSPSVLRIVGNSSGPIALCDEELDFLRSDRVRSRIRPYKDLVIGQKVRIASGTLDGVEGVLVRQKNGLKFVVSVALINQHAAIEVSASDLESVA